MDEIKKGWKIVVFTMLISQIGVVILSWVKSTNNAASEDYVDRKEKKLQEQIDKKADKETVDKMAQQIDFIYQDALTRANRR